MLTVQITLDFFSHGGLMKRSRQETLALLKAGHDVVVITDLRWTSHMYQFEEYKSRLKIIPIKPIYIYGFRNISRQLSFTLKIYYVLKNLAKKMTIDLIVSHLAVSSYVVAPVAKKLNIPSVLVIQDVIRDRIETGNPYTWWETLVFKHSNLYAFKRMNYIVVVSKYDKKLVEMDGANPETTFIKYNAVNTELFTPDEKVQKDIDILFIGRLSIEKGIDILLDALTFLSDRKKVVIIGDGPLKRELELQSHKVKHQNILFEGFIDHTLLPIYIRRSKIVVTPSRSECQASVPLESMACGVPVIASRVSGMEDSIQNGKNSWLLDLNTPKNLGKLIEIVLNDAITLKKVGEIARKRAEFFSENKFNKDIIAFYQSLIETYKKFAEDSFKHATLIKIE